MNLLYYCGLNMIANHGCHSCFPIQFPLTAENIPHR